MPSASCAYWYNNGAFKRIVLDLPKDPPSDCSQDTPGPSASSHSDLKCIQGTKQLVLGRSSGGTVQLEELRSADEVGATKLAFMNTCLH